tara:strand:- start:797 stop:1063 length:267 start_codon:yes stop_codon:yes gene_type:complete
VIALHLCNDALKQKANEMEKTRYRDLLIASGIADSRVASLKMAMVQLHSAYCQLDLSGRAAFNGMVNAKTLREVLIQMAETEDLNTEL